MLYYSLSAYDDEFPDLFKIAADFDDRVERAPQTTLLYARLICAVARHEKLRPLDREAVARVIEQAARLAGDAGKLSTSMRAINALLRESDQLAADAGKDVVSVTEVQAAIDAQFRRGDRIYQSLQEEIGRGTIRIETDGSAIGQVNGLSVISLGALSFGTPSRITAQVRLGRGEVVDIEREVALGGPLHSKGVLILSGFLGGRFGKSRPLSLNASLVFEQSYGGVEGDSASAAELFALLSALAEAPIKQCFAVTGSVDQRGQIQAIGGVNEKIEGFFDSCRLTGFTGRQGVIIPASNVRHLMLRRDVVAAAAEGRFAIYPIDTVDQGLELLTGVPAGEPDSERRVSGRYIEPSHSCSARRLCRSGRRARPQRLWSGGPPLSKPIERVVVALDATAEIRPAIDVAARLAAGAGAPLHAVFVEDEDLLSLAGLEVAREVVAGAGAGPLTAEQLELQLRAAAVRARQDLLAAAQIHALEYSFEIVRGGAQTALSGSLRARPCRCRRACRGR